MRRTARWLQLPLASALLFAACAKGSEVDGGNADPLEDAGDGDAATTPDAPGGSGGGDASSNPCEGVTCDQPPANVCADAEQLTVFDAQGTCDNGQCNYASHQVPCPAGCELDACVGDPCVGVTCNTPPANYCADATHLAVYDTPGQCSGGACSYGTHTEFCSHGCDNDACVGDPCVGVTCTAAPANYCTDADHIEVYTVPGTCDGGACSYPHHNEFCDFGCLSGACEGDPCLGVTCITPPSDYCSDANTARQHESTGTCSEGSCEYATNDVPCTFGCDGGACRECLVQGDCGSGKWCDGSACQACNTNQHCGPSCTNCTTLTPAQTCDATGTTCIQCTLDSQCAGGNWCSNGVCTPCNTAQHCGGTCVACSGATPDCDGSGCVCLSGNCGPPCPVALSIATWNSAADGWTWDGLWKRNSGGYMTAGSTVSYNSSYTENLTYGTDVDLSTCTAATLAFSVRLEDDPDYSSSSDKSERLYVQCSGDGGANWTNLVPNPWPANQSACATSYCSGGYGSSRAFAWTAQSISLPDTCRKATTRFRFQAKGASVWRLMNPGWYVDTVTVN